MPTIKAFSSTAIGSVPYLDTNTALDAMKDMSIPAAPQMVKVSPWEDMFLGALHGLPALIIDEAQQTVRAKKFNRENDLADFYTKFMAGQRDFLALGQESSHGFNAMLERASEDQNFGSEFLKTQIIGPLTFGQMVLMEDEKSSLVDDKELLEATALALGGKAAWQAARIRALGRTPVVFIDEPGLSSFGSAFCSLSKETVIESMQTAAGVVRTDGDVFIGCHVCGNTDWSMMAESGIDIMNFDAFSIMEQFSLYPRQIRDFLEKGSYIAWGIVPSQGFNFDFSAEILSEQLKQGWLSLDKKGVSYDLIASRSIITSACGQGVLTPDEAMAASKMIVDTALIMSGLSA